MRTPGAIEAPATGVLRPLPRRPPLMATAKSGPERLRHRQVERPRASARLVMRRYIAWMASFTRFSLARALDRLRGRDSLPMRGVRMREFFERLGAIAVKIGQQLAVRVDFLPPEVCHELGQLMDHAPAFKFEVAIKRIEVTLRRPVHAVFRHIEPTPIGSASISVVWRGELLDGRVVAIKVRRPGVAELFAADLALVDLFTSMAETLALVRPGFFRNFRFELRDMLMNELDFLQEADYQSLFRRLVKRDKMDWVTAPRVLGELSSSEVMISEFAEGFPCADVLAAVERGDAARLAEYKTRGIDPVRVGNRVLDLGFWMRLESFFFHADPHPGNIFVGQDNKLVMIDFGSCGIASAKQRACEFEAGRRLAQRDITGAANVALASLAPLPDLDIERLRRKAWAAFWARSIDVECGEAEWWERTTASVWLALFSSLQEFQLPVNVDTLRQLRASLLTDTLAFRLNRDLDINKAWKRWIKKAAVRSSRREERRQGRAERYQLPMRITEFSRAREIAERGAFWGDRFVRELPQDVATTVGRASYAFALLLRFALVGTVVVLILVLIGVVLEGWSSLRELILDFVLDVLTHPAGEIVILVFVAIALSKLQAKFDEKERT